MKIVKAAPSRRYHFYEDHLGFIDRLLIRPRRKQPDFNRRMFDEDFARIFRSETRRGRNLFHVISNDDDLTQRLLGNVKLCYGSSMLDETVCNLAENIAQTLIWFGTAYYFLHDTPERDEIHIAPVNANNIFYFLTVYIQFIPQRSEKREDEDDEILPRELLILDRDKLMCFNLPRPIKRILSRQNRTLAVLDKHQYDGIGFFPQATRENPYPENHFDFGVWRDKQEQALYRATRETGWNGRQYGSPKSSEFFNCHRLIRFRRNQLMLRDHILIQLGNELTRVGRQYNARFDVTISPTNVQPKVAELDDLEARLAAEEIGFTEVVDFCYKR